jgi:hypothetical protein
MPAVTLKAHYDGRQILLDEPFELPTNCDLMVTVLQDYSEHVDLTRLASAGLSRAYGDDEPEYSISDLRS